MSSTTTTRSTVYGRTAYEGFAKAIGSQLGLHVTVVDGASACIDASGTIQLPGMNTYQTAREFEVTCGVVVHELAHQFYGSHQLIDPNRARLEHDCLNAVLDVADETWVGAWFNAAGNGRPTQLLESSGRDALRRNTRAYTDWNDPATHAWKVLCMGIFGARLPRREVGRWMRYTAHHAAKLGVDAKACYRLLRRARLGKSENPNPRRKRFRKLLRLAAEIAKLLAPFAPPAGSASSPVTIPIDVATAAGQSTQPKGTVEASEADGASFGDGPAIVAAGGRGRGRGLGGSGFQSTEVEFDTGAFAMLAPAVARVADRIAIDGDGLENSDGLSTGPRLGQAHRLITDGQCLARWDASDMADGVSVSVLLDCSSSMEDVLPQCAGIARAFATAMRNAGAVQTLAFGSIVVESRDFARVSDLGGTCTHSAVERATAWLATRPGQRWIVVVTDGQPGSQALLDDACREALAKGVRILAVGLGCQVNMIGAVSVTAADPAHLAIELDAAAHLIERN
jgi:hypothetical protein